MESAGPGCSWLAHIRGVNGWPEPRVWRCGAELQQCHRSGSPPPPSGWPLTSCDHFSKVVVRHHQSVFERSTVECWASRHNLPCLELKRTSVCGANTLINSLRNDHQSIQLLCCRLAGLKFHRNASSYVANLRVALGGLTQTSCHTVKQKWWIRAADGALWSLLISSTRVEQRTKAEARSWV